LSKKFAEGADSLIFDVKCGGGAFMKNLKEAETLAESLIAAGRGLGRKIVALITGMNEPLGRMVGNFLEAEESALCLRGDTAGREDLMKVTLRLAAWMLVAGGVAGQVDDAEDLCEKKLRTGEPYERFLKNITAQGGDAGAFESALGKRPAPIRRSLTSPRDGFIAGIDAYKTGMAGVYLGAGRSKTTDPVYPHVGIVFYGKKGEPVSAGTVVCDIFAETEAGADAAFALLRDAFTFTDGAVRTEPIIIREYAGL
jgi:pyrimidine-nucleoside phosphorylase